MSQPILTPSDDAIERGLARRAPHRPDIALLGTLMMGVHATKQVSRRGALLRDPVGGVRRPLAWAVFAAVLLLAGSLAFSAGLNPPTIPSPAPSLPAASLPAAVIAPSVAPESTATPSASPVTCATQTTSVLTGNAMPPTQTSPMTVRAGILTVGVYLTAPVDGDPAGQDDVWSIRAGTAMRIASIVGADFNVAKVVDIAGDGRTALIEIGVVHGGSPGPMCSDLYAVRTDGSGAIRLTFNGPDAHADDGVFSHDGRYVAFRSQMFGASTPSIGVVDLQGDATERDYLCDPSVGDLHVAWAPADDRLAAVCGTVLIVMNGGGTPAKFVGGTDQYAVPTGDQVFVGMGWLDKDRIVVVTAFPGVNSNGPIELTTLTIGAGAGTRDGTWSPAVSSRPWLADGSLSTRMAIAPDGHAVTLYGDTEKFDPQGDTIALYAVDTERGTAQRVAPYIVSDIGWSSDSGSLVFVDQVAGSPVLTLYDLGTQTQQRYGSMPTEYAGGIWRAR